MTKKERENLNLVECSNRDLVHYRGSLANHDVHELAKYFVWRELRKLGHFVVTEAVFVSGGRADLFDVTDSTAIEILFSENKEKFDSKDYPVKKIALNASNVVKENLKSF